MIRDVNVVRLGVDVKLCKRSWQNQWPSEKLRDTLSYKALPQTTPTALQCEHCSKSCTVRDLFYFIPNTLINVIDTSVFMVDFLNRSVNLTTRLVFFVLWLLVHYKTFDFLHSICSTEWLILYMYVIIKLSELNTMFNIVLINYYIYVYTIIHNNIVLFLSTTNADCGV